jgi:hypothetical protein
MPPYSGSAVVRANGECPPRVPSYIGGTGKVHAGLIEQGICFCHRVIVIVSGIVITLAVNGASTPSGTPGRKHDA